MKFGEAVRRMIDKPGLRCRRDRWDRDISIRVSVPSGGRGLRRSFMLAGPAWMAEFHWSPASEDMAAGDWSVYIDPDID